MGIATWLLNQNLDFTQVVVGSASIGIGAVGSFETVMKPLIKLWISNVSKNNKKDTVKDSSGE